MFVSSEKIREMSALRLDMTVEYESKLTVITVATALSFNNAGKHFPHCLLSMQRGPTALGSKAKDEKLLVHCYRFGASG